MTGASRLGRLGRLEQLARQRGVASGRVGHRGPAGLLVGAHVQWGDPQAVDAFLDDVDLVVNAASLPDPVASGLWASHFEASWAATSAARRLDLVIRRPAESVGEWGVRVDETTARGRRLWISPGQQYPVDGDVVPAYVDRLGSEDPSGLPREVRRRLLDPTVCGAVGAALAALPAPGPLVDGEVDVGAFLDALGVLLDDNRAEAEQTGTRHEPSVEAEEAVRVLAGILSPARDT